MQTKENYILSGPIWKALLTFFWPCWLGMMFQQLYNTVDTLIVSNYLGTNAVAAVGNVAIAVQVVLGISVSIGNGAGVVIAQHYGAGRTEQLKADIRTSLKIAVIGGLVLTAICVSLAGKMVVWLKSPDDIVVDSTTYLEVYFAGLVPNLTYNFGAALLRGLGDSKRPLYVLVASSFVNIVLDIAFVLTLGLGVFGVALATVIAQTISAVIILFMLARSVPKFWQKEADEQNVYGSIFRIGLPTAVESIMYSSSNVLIQIAINSFTTATIAAWSIYGKVDCICWVTMSSMGMAVTSFAGQNYGAGNYKRVKQCAWVSGVLLAAVLLLLIALCWILAPTIFGWFSSDANVVEIGSHMLKFLTPCYMLYFLIELLPGIMRGCGDVIIPTIASIIGICLVRVIWLETVVREYHTIEMVMMSYVITWGITSLFYVIYFAKANWLKDMKAKA